MPVDWDGENVRKLLLDDGGKIGKFDGTQVSELEGIQPNSIPDSTLLLVADLYGDSRDDLVLQCHGADGKKEIRVVTIPEKNTRNIISKTEQLDYRLWLARNMGGGYRAIFNTQLVEPK